MSNNMNNLNVKHTEGLCVSSEEITMPDTPVLIMLKSVDSTKEIFSQF
jgi:hypothetical protein